MSGLNLILNSITLLFLMSSLTLFLNMHHGGRELKLRYTVRKSNKIFRLRQKQLKREGKSTWG
jgi:hypothetical protein